MNEANKTPKVVGAVVISAVLLVGAYFVLAQNADDAESTTDVVVSSTSETSPEETNGDEQQATEPTANDEEPAAPADSALTYVDGTYNASGVYDVPAGHTEDIAVTLTIEDDVVTALTVETEATNSTSAQHQGNFDPLIDGEVEGKDLDQADVFRLGGASLTSGAFNDLLDAIRSEARA